MEQEEHFAESQTPPPSQTGLKVGNFFSKLFNFATLARWITDQKRLRLGIIPSLGTILALLVASFMIAGAIALWGGVVASTTAFLGIFSKTFVAVMLAGVGNFLFARSIHTALLSARPFSEDHVVGKRLMVPMAPNNRMDVNNIVLHLHLELNEVLRRTGRTPLKAPPRVGYFTHIEPKMTTIFGRNPGKSAVFISSGMLDLTSTKMQPRHFAALLQHEMAKIYLQQGVPNTVVALGNDLLSTLDLLTGGSGFFAQVFFVLTGPLRFFLLLGNSIARSQVFNAASLVVECGRGFCLIEALYKKQAPSTVLGTRYTPLEVKKIKENLGRPVYRGKMAWLWAPIGKWIDSYEWPHDDKTGWRIWAVLEILVQETLTLVNELFSKNVRNTYLLEYLAQKIGYDQVMRGGELTQLQRKQGLQNERLGIVVEDKIQLNSLGKSSDEEDNPTAQSTRGVFFTGAASNEATLSNQSKASHFKTKSINSGLSSGLECKDNTDSEDEEDRNTRKLVCPSSP